MCLPEVRETKIVNGAVVDGPCVTQIPLLETLLGDCSEAGKVGAASLETRKGINQVGIVEIVIGTQVLLVIDAMIDLRRELISPLAGNRSCREGAVRMIG